LAEVVLAALAQQAHHQQQAENNDTFERTLQKVQGRLQTYDEAFPVEGEKSVSMAPSVGSRSMMEERPHTVTRHEAHDRRLVPCLHNAHIPGRQ
jgi:hypothetical protein